VKLVNLSVYMYKSYVCANEVRKSVRCEVFTEVTIQRDPSGVNTNMHIIRRVVQMKPIWGLFWVKE
jgi:hypothetical protein